MNATTLTIVGNLTDAPDLKFTASGAALSRFTVASTPRVFDKQTGQYKDGDPLFLTCTAWRDLAENVAESLQKGRRVVVVGRLQQRSWEDQEGNRRSVVEVQVDEVGPSLRWATATVQKSSRSGGDWAGSRSGGQGGDDWSGRQGGQPGGGRQGDGGDWGAQPPASVSSPDEGGF